MKGQKAERRKGDSGEEDNGRDVKGWRGWLPRCGLPLRPWPGGVRRSQD